MSAYNESKVSVDDVVGVVTDDVTTITWTATNGTLTPTRVDSATAGSATGTITFSATDATAAANVQVAVRALGGIYADATAVAGGSDEVVLTVFGGYDVTWAMTTMTGSVAETTPGKVTYNLSLPIGRFAIAKRIGLFGFNDNSLDVSLVDAGSLNVFVKTALDTSTADADVPYIKQLTADGVAGEDGAAAANVSGGLFAGPITVVVATSSPVGAGPADANASVRLVCQRVYGDAKILQRASGVLAGSGASGDGGSFNLGSMFVNVKRIKIAVTGTVDTSVSPVVTDADGKVIYTKATTDFHTAAVTAQLSMEGVDQAANAIADTLDVIARSPVAVSFGTTLGAGSFCQITTWSVV